MGFGHRVYRAEDPRARVLRRTAKELGAPRFEVAEALEKAALAELHDRRPDRVLATNVEFWAAIMLDFAEVPGAHVHVDVHLRPHRRLARAHPGAEAHRPPDPPVRPLHRPRPAQTRARSRGTAKRTTDPVGPRPRRGAGRSRLGSGPGGGSGGGLGNVFGSGPGIIEALRQQFGQVAGVGAGQLGELGAAGVAVGQHRGAGRRRRAPRAAGVPPRRRRRPRSGRVSKPKLPGQPAAAARQLAGQARPRPAAGVPPRRRAPRAGGSGSGRSTARSSRGGVQPGAYSSRAWANVRTEPASRRACGVAGAARAGRCAARRRSSAPARRPAVRRRAPGPAGPGCAA